MRKFSTFQLHPRAPASLIEHEKATRRERRAISVREWVEWRLNEFSGTSPPHFSESFFVLDVKLERHRARDNFLKWATATMMNFHRSLRMISLTLVGVGNFRVIHGIQQGEARLNPARWRRQPENISLIIKRDAFSHVNEGARGTGRECFM